MWRTLIIAFVLVCVAGAEASAQQVQRPARPYRGLFGGGPPPDPNRTRTEFTFTGTFLGGYDTWVTPGGGGGGIDPAAARQSGRTFTGEAAFNYLYGRTQRSVSIDGRVVSLGYSGLGVDPTIGGRLSVIGTTNLGRVTQLRATQNFGYQPTLVLGGELPNIGDGAPVVSGPEVTSGYLEQRSWSANTSVGLDRRWTARHTTQLGSDYVSATFLDQFGYDTTSFGASAAHTWQFTRALSVRGSYRFGDMSSDAGGGLSTSMTHQQVEGAFGYSRRLSPTRQMSVSITGGGTHVDTVNADDRSELIYWMPSGGGRFAIDVGRSWSIAVNYNRDVQVLEGVSLTSFNSDSANVLVSGLISPRVEAALSALYSNGRAGGTDAAGTYQNYSGSLQLRYAISRCCAAAVYYDYYVYHFRDVPDLPRTFLADLDRHAIRVGFTLWLPLYGSYSDGRGRGAARGN